ncbi:MAG: hypothetical protein AAF417_21680 [Pseudomonadota bacterium]
MSSVHVTPADLASLSLDRREHVAPTPLLPPLLSGFAMTVLEVLDEARETIVDAIGASFDEGLSRNAGLEHLSPALRRDIGA